MQERAKGNEKPRDRERAIDKEKPIYRERAIGEEKPTLYERAIEGEKPKGAERARGGAAGESRQPPEKAKGDDMRKRTCSARCHSAKGTKCRCCCSGFYHGVNGAANREALHQATEDAAKELLKQHGLKEGGPAYIEQMELPLEVATRC